MKAKEDEVIDPVVFLLIEFIKNSRREMPIPPFKAQFISCYYVSESEAVDNPINLETTPPIKETQTTLASE